MPAGHAWNPALQPASNSSKGGKCRFHQNAINCLQRALFTSENTLNMNWKQFA
jgi:hypothetical protein